MYYFFVFVAIFAINFQFVKNEIVQTPQFISVSTKTTMPATHSKDLRASPTKKPSTGKFSKLSSKSNKKIKHELHVVGFPPTPVEAYCFVKVINNSGHNEGYTYNFRKMIYRLLLSSSPTFYS